jgi:hypothetical protein
LQKLVGGPVEVAGRVADHTWYRNRRQDEEPRPESVERCGHAAWSHRELGARIDGGRSDGSLTRGTYFGNGAAPSRDWIRISHPRRAGAALWSAAMSTTVEKAHLAFANWIERREPRRRPQCDRLRRVVSQRSHTAPLGPDERLASPSVRLRRAQRPTAHRPWSRRSPRAFRRVPTRPAARSGSRGCRVCVAEISAVCLKQITERSRMTGDPDTVQDPGCWPTSQE